MNPNTVLWTYIVLLVVGGVVGFLKAGSKASLFASLGFAAALVLCALNLMPDIGVPRERLADALLVALLLVFGIRLAKTKKFVPGGLMLVLTVAALVLRNVKF